MAVIFYLFYKNILTLLYYFVIIPISTKH